MLRLRSYASRILASPFDAKAKGLGANATKSVSEIARFLEQSRILKGFRKLIRFQRELTRRFMIRRTLLLLSPPSTTFRPLNSIFTITRHTFRYPVFACFF